MNIINKIFLIIILTLNCNLILFADQHKDKDLDTLDEELPATNPFLGGAGNTSAATLGNNNLGAQGSKSVLNNLKLVGIISGENKKFAIFSSPEGGSVRYTEDTIIDIDLMIWDICKDHVYFQSNEVEYSVNLDNIIRKVDE